MDENDREELQQLANKARKHRMFVDTNEYIEIDGIPNKIESAASDSYADEYELRRNVDKLRNIAIGNDDPELLDITNKMKRRL